MYFQDNEVCQYEAMIAHTGPKLGPVQAKKAENACKGPKDGPVRAPKRSPPEPVYETARPSRPGDGVLSFLNTHCPCFADVLKN